MMKIIRCFTFILWVMVILGNVSAHAITLAFDPVFQRAIGPQVEVDLTITGLGNATSPSLSTFDLDVSFDSAILSFGGATFGDPTLGDQLDLFGLGSITAVTPASGSVNLFELSLDLPADLDTLQAAAFTLATLQFDTLAAGISDLTISVNALGDAFGNSLIASVETGSITVPEPSTLLLIGIGILGMIGYVWRPL